jgi:hypothetical protein
LLFFSSPLLSRRLRCYRTDMAGMSAAQVFARIVVLVVLRSSGRASTVRYLDAPNNFPEKTMATLGADDVILQVIRSWEPSPPKWEFERHPLRIVRSQIHAGFEGNPTRGRVSEWITSTWRNGSLVQVYVFFGSPVPTASTVAHAQRELSGTRFATWTIRN